MLICTIDFYHFHFIPLSVTLTLVWVTRTAASKPVGFSKNCWWILDGIRGAVKTCQSDETYIISLIDIQVREVNLCTDLFQTLFDIMIDRAKVFILIPVWMAVTLHFDTSVNGCDFDSSSRQLELLQLCCCTVSWVIQTFTVAQSLAVVDCVREMAAKKFCEYGEYGLFEHLFLFLVR